MWVGALLNSFHNAPQFFLLIHIPLGGMIKGELTMSNQQAMGQNQTTLQITGMTCVACANRIEKGLNKLEGVSEATVNFALEQASVIYDPSKVNMTQMEQKIQALGYDTVKETIDFQITGMTCAACATRIEKGLSKLPGVAKATVNLALETAHVEYTPTNVSVNEMMKKVEQLGYKAEPKQEQKETGDHRVKEIKKQKLKLTISAILSLPLLWAMVSHFSFTSFIWLPDLFDVGHRLFAHINGIRDTRKLPSH